MMFSCTRLLSAALIAISLYSGTACTVESASRADIAKIMVNRQGTDFKYWNEKAAAKKKLIEYVKAVTNPKSPDFIPVEDRIAVFDMDGTLIGERTPIYFEWIFYSTRLFDDPSYKATPESLQIADMALDALINNNITNETFDLLISDLNKVFSGLNEEQFAQTVKRAMDTPVLGMSNIKYGEEIYFPMMEVLSFLKANDFTLYIVSGSNRQMIREYVKGVIPIPSNHLIGADIVLKATNQGNAHVKSYIFDVDNDEIITTETETECNVGINKVIKIAREIGKKPVLSFGNSMGDASMHQYTKSNRKYKTLSFTLLCDDLERDYGSLKEAEKIRKACDKYGWIPVSMRDDWKTIYGYDVKRTNYSLQN